MDPIALGIPDYFEIIKRPMDLGTVTKKLEDHDYTKAEECVNDIRQVFTNCRTYNPPGNDSIMLCGLFLLI